MLSKFVAKVKGAGPLGSLGGKHLASNFLAGKLAYGRFYFEDHSLVHLTFWRAPFFLYGMGFEQQWGATSARTNIHR